MTTSRRLPHDFNRSAAYPLFAFDPVQELGWVLHFTAEDYRQASFLDRRALRPQISGWEIPKAELDDGLLEAGSPRPLHWLFHIGHCGSSLASRLLDQLPGVLGLREPLPLLALAQAPDDTAAQAWFGPTLAMLGRGFADTSAVIVKPTSLVTTIADRLLAHSPGKACLLWVDLQSWLATMLRDINLRENALATEALRLRDIGLDDASPATSEGERMARLWLAEQLRWKRLASDARFALRLMDLDFAELLTQPAAVSARLAAHYGLAAPEDWAERIASSGLLERYSKDAAQRFDAQARERELAQSRVAHAEAIDAGLSWAERALEALNQPALLTRLRPSTSG